jgi:hypothetical protein
MQIAMTVGATKIQIIQESTLASMTGEVPEKETSGKESGDSGCEP